MRVLMFGWEFPPYMSGGLGTACYGMTRALAGKGTEVLFVLPRMEGHDAVAVPQGLSLRGASGTRIAWTEGDNADTVYHKAVTNQPLIQPSNVCQSTTDAETRAAVVRDVWQKRLQMHPIDSSLHAYATPQSYADIQTLYQSATNSYMYDPCTMPLAFLDQADGLVSPETSEQLLQVVQRNQGQTKSGETVISLHGGYGQGLMDEVFRYSQSVLGLQDENFDVIHVHDWMTYPAGIVAKRLSGKPLVAHIHALESDRSGSNLNPEVATIERAGLEAADVIVAVSHYTKTRVTELYGIDPQKIVVVHNAVTREESRAQLDIPTHSTDEKYVLFMGRITFQKGPEYFVEAAKLVLSRMPNVRFIMAGSGDMLSRMVRMVARMRMGNRFHFTGFLRGEDVDRMYAMSDLYVMPSVSEPFGIAPLEAMAYDTPVLISRQSGVAEVVQNALKVDFWDVRGMADKICSVLAHPRLAGEMTKQCREELQHIRWENAANKLIGVYENCLQKA